MTDDEETRLLRRYAVANAGEVPLLFILGAPRTGSTLCYQLIVNRFDTFYFSNSLVDRFAEQPIVGAARAGVDRTRPAFFFESEYGKTTGEFEPSEASAIFKHWFGGEHPSQDKSAEPIAGRSQHLLSTLAALYGLTGKTLVTKNAWNCFRVRWLSQAFKRSGFIWMRRDIRVAAASDLRSRRVHGGLDSWNSATPSNVEEIKKLPHHHQVVEQQAAFNAALSRDLEAHAAGRYIEVWYEDLCANTVASLDAVASLASHLDLPLPLHTDRLPDLIESPPKDDDDFRTICAYATDRGL